MAVETAVDTARLERALNPRTVVVVGDKGPRYTWLNNLEEFTGQVYSVQLDEKEIPGIEALGVTNYTSLLDVPGEVDLLICAVPRQVTPYVIADAVKKGVGGVSMYTSGFAETGEPEAVGLQAKLVELCREARLPLIGPNCLGIYNRRLGVKFSQQQDQGEGGDISIISQSGQHGTGLTLGAQRSGVRVTRAISIGNAVVLNEADYLQYLLDDDETPAIAMYLEGMHEGRRFFDLLREGTKRKPVIIWRGGRSKAGARAVRSHTGSLASDDAVWEAMIRQAGAIGARSIDETIDAMAALVHTPRPEGRIGRGLALIAMTGGQAVAITDQFERVGFEVPELSQSSYDRLAEFFTVIGGSYRNPFDAASTIRDETEHVRKLLDIIVEDGAIDGGVAMELRARGYEEHPEQLDATLDLLRQYRERTGLPVVTMMPTGGPMGDTDEFAHQVREKVAQSGFPIYPNFERGAAALGRVVDYYQDRAERT